MLQPIKFSVRDYLKSEAVNTDFQNGVVKLAELGWVLPITLGFSSIKELGKNQLTSEDIDRWFVDYFSQNEFSNFNSLLLTINEAPSLTEWSVLLDECSKSFASGYKIVAIPALLTVIEGGLSKRLGTFKSKNIRVVDPAKKIADGIHPHELVKSLWESLQMVVSKLYESSDFSRDRPIHINRHWILHGRDSAQWTEADFFRLFNLLGAIAIA